MERFVARERRGNDQATLGACTRQFSGSNNLHSLPFGVIGHASVSQWRSDFPGGVSAAPIQPSLEVRPSFLCRADVVALVD